MLPEVRKSIHVGNLTFHDGFKVEEHLLEDVMKTIKPWLAILMDNYRVSKKPTHAPDDRFEKMMKSLFGFS